MERRRAFPMLSHFATLAPGHAKIALQQRLPALARVTLIDATHTPIQELTTVVVDLENRNVDFALTSVEVLHNNQQQT